MPDYPDWGRPLPTVGPDIFSTTINASTQGQITVTTLSTTDFPQLYVNAYSLVTGHQWGLRFRWWLGEPNSSEYIDEDLSCGDVNFRLQHILSVPGPYVTIYAYNMQAAASSLKLTVVKLNQPYLNVRDKIPSPYWALFASTLASSSAQAVIPPTFIGRTRFMISTLLLKYSVVISQIGFDGSLYTVARVDSQFFGNIATIDAYLKPQLIFLDIINNESYDGRLNIFIMNI